jgi:hypothetical protein
MHNTTAVIKSARHNICLNRTGYVEPTVPSYILYLHSKYNMDACEFSPVKIWFFTFLNNSFPNTLNCFFQKENELTGKITVLLPV